MRPLLLVNWRRVNAGFCLLMWAIAIVLAAVVLAGAAHGAARSPVAHAPAGRATAAPR